MNQPVARARRVLPWALILALAAVLVVPVFAHTKRWPTNSSKPARASSGSGIAFRYSGRVNSPKPACERRRLVILRVAGSPFSEDTRTNRNGRWSLELVTPVDDYRLSYTVTFDELAAGAGHEHLCGTFQRTYTYPGAG